MSEQQRVENEFHGKTLAQLLAAVEHDDPAAMRRQAAAWRDLAHLLDEYGASLNNRLTQVRKTWTGASIEVYSDQVQSRSETLLDACAVADSNGNAWENIASAADEAQRTLRDINSRYEKDPAAKAQSKLPAGPGGNSDVHNDTKYDVEAREFMKSIAGETDFQKASMNDHGGFESFPEVSLPEDRHPGGGRDGGGGPSPRPGLPSPGGHIPAPELTGPPVTIGPPLTPAPGPIVGLPVTPAPGPIVGLPVIPGPGLPTPPPPGGKPPIGVKPPIGTKPPSSGVPKPPAVGTPRPVPPPRGGGGTKPPIPRGPQSTVKPVIGSRPGSSGMAPTSNKPTPKSLTKPVIGQRPNTPSVKPNSPKGSLIGKDGVARPSQSATNRPRAITRTPPKVKSGGEALNRAIIRSPKPAPKPIANPNTIRADVKRMGKRRDEDRTIKSDGPLDAFWNEPETVPGVITSRPAKASVPGPVLRLHGDSYSDSSERESLAKLSASDSHSAKNNDTTLWTPRAAGRGVIANSVREELPGDDLWK